MMMKNFCLGWVYGWRQLRHDYRQFTLFMLCLIFGSLAMMLVAGFSAAMMQGLLRDGQQILGGDISLRSPHQPPAANIIERMASVGRLSASAEMRIMVRASTPNSPPLLADLKAVDSAYPLYGQLQTQPPLEAITGQALVVDPLILQQLHVRVGDQLLLGDKVFTISAVLQNEPDRLGAATMMLGPRIIMSLQAFQQAGLGGVGSLIYWQHKIKLAAARQSADVKQALAELNPALADSIKTADNPSPEIMRVQQQLGVVLSLISLASLCTGGLGMVGAMQAFARKKLKTAAAFKAAGASDAVVFWQLYAEGLMMAIPAIMLGLILGAAGVMLVAGFIPPQLIPVDVDMGVLVKAAFWPALMALLVAALACLMPAMALSRTSPALLFRAGDGDLPPLGWRQWPYYLPLLGGIILLVIVAWLAAGQQILALFFMAGLLGCYLFYQLLGMLSRYLLKIVPFRQPYALQIARLQLVRSPSLLFSVMLSLGVGLTLLSAVFSLQQGFSHHFTQHAGEQPDFFFIDVQDSQKQQFTDILQAHGAQHIELQPMLRVKISKINGKAAAKALVNENYAWVLRGDRGLTIASEPPPHSPIIAGNWWSETPQIPHPPSPQMSISSEIAAAFGLKLGDEITIAVLGREISFTIANIRKVQWITLSMNFTIIVAPGSPLDHAPKNWLGTAIIPQQQQPLMMEELSRLLPNISQIKMSEALAQFSQITEKMSLAVTLVASTTLISGLLVLAGSLMATQHERRYRWLIFSTLGASARMMQRIFFWEFFLAGFVASSTAALLGQGLAQALLHELLGFPIEISPLAALASCLLGSFLCLSLMMWESRELQKISPFRGLRNE
ncbi:MAG: ABC transporter permease [Alphaproteobacteria bacterium]